ncbi:hypothetical protein PS2_015363 [Malus domestica]
MMKLLLPCNDLGYYCIYAILPHSILLSQAKIQINGCFPPPTGGGVAEGFPKMKQHEKYARVEVLSLQRKAAELHAKIIKAKEGLFFLGEVKKLLGEQEMKQTLDFGPICAIMDWHPCMLSYAKFQETIVPPMPYGIELCTDYACENEGKAVIKSCYFCGYADLHSHKSNNS